MEEHVLAPLPGLLLPWFRQNARDLPWRRDREPYHVWLSEIMLQQTRVEAVRGYYLRFLQELPTVEALAEAPEDRLLKLWEGLGYYNRARNLQKAARRIAAAGAFPDTYEGLLALPGVGAYTAGAVASICFGLPAAAVDGNAVRVTARFLADPTPDSPALKRLRKAQLEAVVPAGRAGDFTQALMELGATVCLPNGPPRCGECPLRDLCAGRETPAAYPGRVEKKPRKRQQRTVFLLWCGERLAVEKRPDTGLLAGLWQLPNLPGLLTPQQALRQAADWGAEPHDLLFQREKIHIFTHIQWEMEGYAIACGREDPRFVWADEAGLARAYPLPTAFRQFLRE